jgi:hypothetical protein
LAKALWLIHAEAIAKDTALIRQDESLLEMQIESLFTLVNMLMSFRLVTLPNNYRSQRDFIADGKTDCINLKC